MFYIQDENTENPHLNKMIKRALAKDPQGVTRMQRLIDSLDDVKIPGKSKFKVAPKEDRTSRDNIVFDSKQESDRYQELLYRVKAKEIGGLVIQKRYQLINDFEYKGKKYKGVYYLADFYYLESHKNDRYYNLEVVEEWKVEATRTKDYIIKMKMFLNRYPSIDFREMIGNDGK